LSGTYVRAALERLARRAGIAKRVHPHLLRHSCAARLAAQGLDGTVLASQLGQRSLRGARRALQRFGVRLERNDRTSLAHIAWSLAPEPGCVRVCVNAPIARSRSSRGAIVVQRWRPEAL
jgi:integrase